MMDSIIPRLGLALAIGLLVGLERGWRDRDAPAGSRTAGIRTYGIAGLLGGAFGALAQEANGGVIFGSGFLGFALSFSWFKLREARRDDDFSITGVFAGLCVFALGGMAVAGDYQAAAAGAAALAALLASRDVLHTLVQRLSWVELRSALVLAVMTAIVLPLIPDRTIDPWAGFNPREVWLFTVLSAAISYAGYIAVRILGSTKGLVVSSLAGALVSSTAVTASFGQMARSGEAPLPLAGAAILAAVVSILRVLAIVLLIAPGVFPQIVAASLTAALVLSIVGGSLLTRRAVAEQKSVAAKNPFQLAPLAIFAGLFALTTTISAALVSRMGDSSLVVFSAVSGTFDVDVAVLSALRNGQNDLPLQIVGQAVLAAMSANAIGRFLVAVASQTFLYWLPIALASTLAMSAGFAVLVAL